MLLTRRFVLSGLLAAPAIIAINKLMPVKSSIYDYVIVGNGKVNFDVGIFYCPYIPLSFTPVNFTTRYEKLVANEFDNRFSNVERAL